MIHRAMIALATCLAFATPAGAGQEIAANSYAPRNECRGDRDSAAFLDSLAMAVDARDIDALLALAADDVHLDFGGGSGKDELRARLDGTNDAYGDLWFELASVMSLGCARHEPESMTMPWYFEQDFGNRDAFSTMLVIQYSAKLRASPDYDAEPIRSLNWDVVEVPGDFDSEASFTEVVLPDQSRGYVETTALRSLIDYRLLAERTDQGWKIVAFIAGD